MLYFLVKICFIRFNYRSRIIVKNESRKRLRYWSNTLGLDIFRNPFIWSNSWSYDFLLPQMQMLRRLHYGLVCYFNSHYVIRTCYPYYLWIYHLLQWWKWMPKESRSIRMVCLNGYPFVLRYLHDYRFRHFAMCYLLCWCNHCWLTKWTNFTR